MKPLTALLLLSLLLAAPLAAAPRSAKVVAERLRKAVAKGDRRAIASALPTNGLIRMTTVSSDEEFPDETADKPVAAIVEDLAAHYVTVGKRVTCKGDCCDVTAKVYPKGSEDRMGTLGLMEICVGPAGVTSLRLVPEPI